MTPKTSCMDGWLRSGRQRMLALALCTSCALLASSAVAGMITVTVAAPKVAANTAGSVTLQSGVTRKVIVEGNKEVDALVPTADIASVAVGPADTQKTKRDALFQNIQRNPDIPDGIKKRFTDPGNDRIVFDVKGAQLPDGSALILRSTNTGEALDTFRVKDDATSAIVGFFDDFDSTNDTGLTEFVVGVLSDLGSVTRTLTSLAFADLHGATITSTFFDIFKPLTPAIGVDTFLVDGEIVFDFRPGTTHNDGGVSFGTTSAHGTVVGGINVIPVPGSLELVLLAIVLLAAVTACREPPLSIAAARVE